MFFIKLIWYNYFGIIFIQGSKVFYLYIFYKYNVNQVIYVLFAFYS